MMNTHPHYLYSDVVNSIKAEKATIEAMAGLSDGTIAYATDTDEFGTYSLNTNTWTWLGAGVLLYVQDEGIPVGTPNTLNFVGDNVSVSISGTVARVYVTGSVGDNIGFITTLPGVYAYATGSQNVPHNTSTVMDVGGIVRNDWNGWSASEPNKIRVNETGFYLVGGNMMWNNDPGVGRRITNLFVTGSSVLWKYPSQNLLDSPTYAFSEQTVSTLQYLYSGSYIQLEVLQNSTGTITNFPAGTTLWASKFIVSGSVQGSVTNITNTNNVTNNIPGFLVQDEGVPLGTGTVFNFVGNNVDVSVSGTVAMVFVTGSTGGQASTDGWNTDNNTWTFLSADAPSYVVSVNANVTGTIGVGMKTQLTHQSTTKNFFVTAVSVTGSTSYLNLYGGTDYTLNVTGTITNPKYSQAKSPFGFPTSPAKWTVTATDTSNRSQASPTTDVWYNLGSFNIVIPIGVWNVRYQAMISSTSTAGQTAVSVHCTMSTANNTESDSSTSSVVFNGGAAGTLFSVLSVHKAKLFTLTNKTTYFFNLKTSNSNSASIATWGASYFPTTIEAICAYL